MKCFGPKNIKKAGVFLAKGSRCLGQRMVEDLNSRNPLYDENYHILISSFYGQYFLKNLDFFFIFINVLN